MPSANKGMVDVNFCVLVAPDRNGILDKMLRLQSVTVNREPQRWWESVSLLLSTIFHGLSCYLSSTERVTVGATQLISARLAFSRICFNIFISSLLRRMHPCVARNAPSPRQ